MAGFWGKRKREEQEALEAQDADLARRARTALVAADERIRLDHRRARVRRSRTRDRPTRELREALDSVRTHLAEAFHLNQLNLDEIPDTPEELRTRNARIVQLSEWAEDLLDDRTGALAEPIARARRAPEIIAGVRADAARLRTRIPHARETVARMAVRYSPDALKQVARTPTRPSSSSDSPSTAPGRGAPARGGTARAGEPRTRSGHRGRPARGHAHRRGRDLRGRGAARGVDALGDRRGSRDDLVVARTAPQVPAVAAAMAELERRSPRSPPPASTRIRSRS